MIWFSVLWPSGRELHGGLGESDIELHWTRYRSPSSSPYNSSPNNPSSGRPSTSSETSQLLPTPPHSTPSSPSPVHQERQNRWVLGFLWPLTLCIKVHRDVWNCLCWSLVWSFDITLVDHEKKCSFKKIFIYYDKK